MRRPMLLFLFAQAAGILLAYYADARLWIALAGSAGICAAVWALKKRKIKTGRLAAAAVVFFLAGALTMSWAKAYTGKYADLDGEIVSGKGIVTKVEMRDDYAAVTVRSGRESVLVRLTGAEDQLSVYSLTGRKVSFTGQVERPDSRRNIGSFDYRVYLKGRGINVIFKVSSYRFYCGRTVLPLLNFLSVKKGQFYALAESVMSEDDFSVMSGLLFGDTNYMDEDLYQSFQHCGIAHVLAVSGLHVSLLFSVVTRLLGGRRSKPVTAAILVILFFYAALSGFSVSVLRAGLMISLNLLSVHLEKRYDMVSAASLAASLMLITSPFLIFDSGTQLSFTAAYTMGIALPWAQNKVLKLSDKYKSELLYKAGNFLAPCAVVQAGMTPLTQWHFLVVSPIALLLNPFAVGLAGILLPAGLVSFILSTFCPPALTCASLKITSVMSKLMLLIAEAGDRIGGFWDFPAPAFGILALYYLFFFWFFSETRFILNRRQKQKALAAAEAFLIAAGTVLPCLLGISSTFIPWDHANPPVVFVDVGQGDCIHVNSGGINILIDGGGSYYTDVAEKTLKPYLLKNGVTRIDLAVVTHEDLDHSRGIYQLAEIFPVDRIAVMGTDNDDCAVCRVCVGGISILLMSDADSEREKLLVSKYGSSLESDVLKVGHHGSAGSTSIALLKTAKPLFAVISCGKYNSYGHPSSRVVELLENSGIIYGRTDQYGAIYLSRISGDTLVFQNAAKDQKWLIRRTRQTPSTQARP